MNKRPIFHPTITNLLQPFAFSTLTITQVKCKLEMFGVRCDQAWDDIKRIQSKFTLEASRDRNFDVVEL